MTVSADLLAQLRRMVAEPTAVNYTDAALSAYVEKYPVIDEHDRDPKNPRWEPTYDLHAAAQDVWEEKAAAISGHVDFSADGGSYQQSQAYQAAMGQARYHGARRKPSSKKMVRAQREHPLPGWEGFDSGSGDL